MQNNAVFTSPIVDNSNSSVIVKDSTLFKLNFSNLEANVIWIDFNVLALPLL